MMSDCCSCQLMTNTYKYFVFWSMYRLAENQNIVCYICTTIHLYEEESRDTSLTIVKICVSVKFLCVVNGISCFTRNHFVLTNLLPTLKYSHADHDEQSEYL